MKVIQCIQPEEKFVAGRRKFLKMCLLGAGSLALGINRASARTLFPVRAKTYKIQIGKEARISYPEGKPEFTIRALYSTNPRNNDGNDIFSERILRIYRESGEKLRTLVFTPSTEGDYNPNIKWPANLPRIGDLKLYDAQGSALFEDHVANYYDFTSTAIGLPFKNSQAQQYYAMLASEIFLKGRGYSINYLGANLEIGLLKY